MRSSFRSSDMPVELPLETTGGRPLDLEAVGFRKRAASILSKPPEELRGLRLGYALRVVEDLPGGLPRLAEPRLEPASRLVLAYLRVLVFPFFLGGRTLAVSVIFGIIAQRVFTHPQPGFSSEIR